MMFMTATIDVSYDVTIDHVNDCRTSRKCIAEYYFVDFVNCQYIYHINTTQQTR